MVRKLHMTGCVCGREPERKVSSYYSWPTGKLQKEVEELIKNFRKSFCKTTIILEHQFEDL